MAITLTTPTTPPLQSLDSALDKVLAQVQPLARAEWVSTFDADGRVLAQDVISPLNVPAFDNSQMDGYAVRVADLQVDASGDLPVLPCSQRIAAGQAPSVLQPLSVARIFTGAPVPLGADAVVMQEDVSVVNECEGGIRFHTMPTRGQWIRRAGEDVSQGAVVLSRGSRLAPAALGLAASVGMAQLLVTARPRVALFSTGDELVMPGEVAPQDMKLGSIYNSNRFFLRALLRRAGCEVTDFGIVPDCLDSTVKALSDAALNHDVVVTSGGVSVGEEDHVKPAVRQLGELDVWQIAMKPGKPFAFGKIRRCPPHELGSDPNLDPNLWALFVGLPGNPVSSFVTFLLLLRPLLLRLQGVDQVCPMPFVMRADFDWPHADKRREFLRVRRNSDGGLDVFANQSSAVLTSAVWGDGLVDKPAGQTIRRGDEVLFFPFMDGWQ